MKVPLGLWEEKIWDLFGKIIKHETLLSASPPRRDQPLLLHLPPSTIECRYRQWDASSSLITTWRTRQLTKGDTYHLSFYCISILLSFSIFVIYIMEMERSNFDVKHCLALIPLLMPHIRNLCTERRQYIRRNMLSFGWIPIVKIVYN